MTQTTCYACAVATEGDEHFPPKAFIPEARRGIPGTFELLPACRTHNQDRSADDQYVMSIVAMLSPYTYTDDDYRAKVHRGLHRRESSLFNRIDRSTTTTDAGTMIECETSRLHRVLGDMACAAHFVTTGEKVLGRRVVSTAGISPLRDKDVDADPRAQHNPALGWLLRAFCETEAFSVRGVQPDLFWYQVSPAGAVRLVLHEAVEAFVVWSSTAPLVILEHAADWLEANERPEVADEYRRFTRASLGTRWRA